MPKITKHYTIIDGKEYEIEVWYTQKGKFFYKTGKNDVVDKRINQLRVYDFHNKSNTPEELHRSLLDSIKRMNEYLSESEKVIVIRAAFSKDVSSAPSGRGGRKLFAKSTSYDHGVEIDFDVMMKQTVGEKVYYSSIKEDGSIGYRRESSIHGFDEYYEIPYSKEAEEFLLGACASLDNMAARVFNFLAGDGLEQRILNASSNMLLGLPSPSNK